MSWLDDVRKRWVRVERAGLLDPSDERVRLLALVDELAAALREVLPHVECHPCCRSITVGAGGVCDCHVARVRSALARLEE